jgi:hypothetical protein
LTSAWGTQIIASRGPTGITESEVLKALGEPTVTQEQFDAFVDSFNEDYLLLLTRASNRQYDCLITSFSILKDLHDAICILYDNGGLVYNKLMYPFSFRADDQLLARLGFIRAEIENINAFLPYVKASVGMELEEYLNSGRLPVCGSPR